MKYINSDKKEKIYLNRDLKKHIKRGNPWIFADAIHIDKKIKSGSYSILCSPQEEILGHGIYCSKTNLAFRIVNIGDVKISDFIIEKRIDECLQNKKHLYHSTNNCLRLINGEGDLLPGIVCDIYHQIAVLKIDGEACENFWNVESIAEYLFEQKIIPLTCIYLKRRNNQEEKGRILKGSFSDLTQVQFFEHGVLFETNLIDAAKTGFFIDQRENRNFIKKVSAQKSLLNLFGYTGGFSIYAGLGGSNLVTTVDIAPEAIKAANKNWLLNNLNPSNHEGITIDAFEFVKNAQAKKQTWDIVITDPPSFAPNAKSVENAKKAYIDIFSDSLKLVKHGGYFAASSCSGHIGTDLFLELCQEALSKSQRRGKVLLINGQPEDHPFPLALPELRYLKFVYMQVFKD